MRCPICEYENVLPENAVCSRCNTDLSANLLLSQFPDALYNEAVRLLQEGQLETARGKLIAAGEFNPADGAAFVLLGKVCAETGEYVDALQHWQRAQELGIPEADLANDREQVELLCRETSVPQPEPVETVAPVDADRLSMVTLRRARTRWGIGTAVAASLGLAVGAWFPRQPPERMPVTEMSRLSEIGQSRSPQQLPIEEVRQVLESKGIRGITVEVREGVVCLRGKVRTLEERYGVERVARRAPGVKTLDPDGLKVAYPNGYHYRVQRGDSLSRIVRQTLGSADYSPLLTANPELAHNPSVLEVGQRILIPE